MVQKQFSRRDFLKTAMAGVGGLALSPWQFSGLNAFAPVLAEFPQGERLGRVLDSKVDIKLRPDEDSPTVGVKYIDEMVVWLREVVGKRPMWYNQRYVETPEGYIYAPNLQPVKHLPNQPITEMNGLEGFWVEVTVPYVDLTMANPPARSPWLSHTQTPRLYYSQIMWVDDIKTDEQGQTFYRVGERYGSFGDIFWADAQAFRLLDENEISPISPDAEDKRVEVDVTYQTLSCFEGQQEVFFCRVSTGPKVVVDGSSSLKWATPLGTHTIWRKLVSVHMTGGTTGGGYDLPGIGWTVLFSGQGMAIHSTFWHNSYGVPRSHGCVNANPDDAKWIFRWTLPFTPALPGDVTISGKGSSKVVVVEK